jgi:hypothetical protein
MSLCNSHGYNRCSDNTRISESFASLSMYDCAPFKERMFHAVICKVAIRRNSDININIDVVLAIMVYCS